MNTLTLPISNEEKALLHRLAASHQRSDEEIASEALRDYLRFEAAQIKKIQDGIDAADSGDIATGQEVTDFFAKYGSAN